MRAPSPLMYPSYTTVLPYEYILLMSRKSYQSERHSNRTLCTFMYTVSCTQEWKGCVKGDQAYQHYQPWRKYTKGE